jgi:hypothetical protein
MLYGPSLARGRRSTGQRLGFPPPIGPGDETSPGEQASECDDTR